MDSRFISLDKIQNKVDLIVTSPPYPMIEMWDELFASMNSNISEAINKFDGNTAFELMHKELDKVWISCANVLNEGGIFCINIGDATRTLNSKFQLYSNHSRIISKFIELGFSVLPTILWRKQTNSPNKFMGSGMLPVGAYVTLEHEYILIFRKGSKRSFITNEDKSLRRMSSFFWEERNNWFSDIWDFKGVRQDLKKNETRKRSAAFPFELAYRLINMFSVKNDLVLDPFLGTGTVTFAAIASKRNSIGVEIDSSFNESIKDETNRIIDFSNTYIQQRINKHYEFILNCEEKEKDLKYINKFHGFKVMTSQETDIVFEYLNNISHNKPNHFVVNYTKDNKEAELNVQTELAL